MTDDERAELVELKAEVARLTEQAGQQQQKIRQLDSGLSELRNAVAKMMREASPLTRR